MISNDLETTFFVIDDCVDDEIKVVSTSMSQRIWQLELTIQLRKAQISYRNVQNDKTKNKKLDNSLDTSRDKQKELKLTFQMDMFANGMREISVFDS